MIQQMFWSKEKTGWKFHQGILPSHGIPEDVVVAIDADSIEVLAAQEEDQGVLKERVAQENSEKHERSHRDGGLFRASGGEDRRAFWNESRHQF